MKGNFKKFIAAICIFVVMINVFPLIVFAESSELDLRVQEVEGRIEKFIVTIKYLFQVKI